MDQHPRNGPANGRDEGHDPDCPCLDCLRHLGWFQRLFQNAAEQFRGRHDARIIIAERLSVALPFIGNDAGWHHEDVVVEEVGRAARNDVPGDDVVVEHAPGVDVQIEHGIHEMNSSQMNEASEVEEEVVRNDAQFTSSSNMAPADRSDRGLGVENVPGNVIDVITLDDDPEPENIENNNVLEQEVDVMKLDDNPEPENIENNNVPGNVIDVITLDDDPEPENIENNVSTTSNDDYRGNPMPIAIGGENSPFVESEQRLSLDIGESSESRHQSELSSMAGGSSTMSVEVQRDSPEMSFKRSLLPGAGSDEKKKTRRS